MFEDRKELEFTEDKHIYKIKNIILPSVTNIIEPIARSVYDDVNEYRMEKARVKGHEVHFAVDLFHKTGHIEIEEQYKGYLDGYFKFLKDHEGRIEILKTEHKTYHKVLKYAGTSDIIALLDGVLIVIDLKTTIILNKILTQLQLPAYKESINSWQKTEKTKIKDCYTLQLTKDADYNFDKVEENYDIFLKLFSIYNYISKNK
jgi:hypothetical protein